MRDPRDADDERSERRDVPTRNYGQQPPEGGEHGGGRPQGQGESQQPPRGGRQPSQQGGRQPQQRGQSQQPQGQRGQGGHQQGGQQGHQQRGQQGTQGGHPSGRRTTQPRGQQQPPQRQGQQRQGQQQAPQHQGQFPPRQPTQTPSQTQDRGQGGRQQTGQGGHQQAGRQSGAQGGHQQSGYQQHQQTGSARVTGDWQRSSGSHLTGQQSSGTGPAGGQQPTPRRSGEGTPGIDQSSTLSQPIHPRTVDELMTEDVVTATGDETLQEVAARMATEEVGTVVVVDDDNTPTGIISDRTIALSIDDEGTLAERHVSDVMAGDVVTITEGSSVYEVTERLSEAGIRRIPVVDGDDELQGIISVDDVIVLLSKELQNVSDVVSTQTSKL